MTIVKVKGFKVGSAAEEPEEEKVPGNPYLAEIKNILKEISSKLKPAASKKEANMRLTTHEFISKVKEHYPGADALSDEEFYQLFKELGYIYNADDNASIGWLIKKT